MGAVEHARGAEPWARLRLIGRAADAGLALVAMDAIFLAGNLPPEAAFGAAASLTGIGLFLARASSELEDDRDASSTPQAALLLRMAPFYLLAVSVAVLLFPEPFGPAALYLLAFAEVPILGLLSLSRARVAGIANSGLLVAGANAAGGPGIVPLTLAWFLLLAAALAFGHLAERAEAAESRSCALEPALLPSLAGAAVLATVYLAALLAIPARAAAPVAPETSPSSPDGRAVEPPWSAVAMLLGAVALMGLVIYLYHRFARRGRAQAVPDEDDDGALALRAAEGIDVAPEAEEGEAAAGARAAAIAEFRAFERELGARDCGRAASEGAGEHASALAVRFPRAAGALVEVAGIFERARYGADEVSPHAARALREAARRALGTIDAVLRP